MKVNPNTVSTTTQAAVSDSKTADSKRAEASATSTAALPTATAFSSRIQVLGAQVAAGEVVNHAKVEAISRAIAAGTFKVDADAVAGKMIQDSLDMLAKGN